MSTLFTLAQASLRFRQTTALDRVDLQVWRGERVALIGANGSGKSTLLRVLHGLLDLGDGRREVDHRARQAMLFQRPHMLHGTAQNHVALGLWLAGQGWRAARAQALPALRRVGLEAQAQRGARHLSGGQQQRLALARAWALRPEVLLLDEPTASLDPNAKREVEALLAEFAAGDAEAGPMTLVFASHNLGQVKRLASRVVYLEQGRVLADLSVHDFFNGPLPEAAQQFVKGEIG